MKPTPHITKAEVLATEHQDLAIKRFAAGLTSPERERLTQVRRHLNQLESAELGPALDRLERIVAFREQTAAAIRDLVANANRRRKRSA